MRRPSRPLAWRKKSSYYPAYAQSMTVDHETKHKPLLGGYQGQVGQGYFFEVSKEDGSLLSMVKPEERGAHRACSSPMIAVGPCCLRMKRLRHCSCPRRNCI